MSDEPEQDFGDEPLFLDVDDHCGNDCGGTSSNDGTGEWYEPEECVCCECCCTCTPCEYARVA